MAMTSPYRSLSAARRVDLVTRAIKLNKESRAVFVQRMVARGGGFRAVTLQTWPADKLAREIVRLNAESADDELNLLHLLYVELEPAIQVAFLDVAGVAHEGGKIPDDLKPPYCDAAAVARAAAAVCDLHGDDGRHYLTTIARYNLESWPGLDTVLAETSP
jgi:hypothetical protein